MTIDVTTANELSASDAIASSLDNATYNANIPEIRQAAAQDGSPFNTDTILEGLRNVLGNIQSQVNDLFEGENLSNLGNTNGGGLPFLGSNFANKATEEGSAGQFVQSLYNAIESRFQQAFGTAKQATASEIQTVLFEIFGPNGLFGTAGILKDSDDAGADISVADIRVEVDATGQLTVDLGLGQRTTLADVNLPQNVGLPALGLDFGTNSTMSVDLDYTFNLGFGINAAHQFFLDTTPDADPSAPEVAIALLPTLPTTTATMGLLQVDATNAGSNFNFSLDLTDGNDNQLIAGESLTTTPTGSAAINLNLVSSIVGAAVLPRVGTDLAINWDFTQNGAVPTVSFNNTTVYFGEFLGDFLEPVLQRVNQITAPIRPISTVLNQEIDFLNVSLLDLFELGGQVSGIETVTQFTKALTLIDQLTQLTSQSESAQGYGINLGNVQLTNLDLRNASTPISNPSLATTGTISSTANSTYDSFLNLRTSEFGLSFPLIERPESAINLLLGQNIDLLRFDLPDLAFEAGISKDIPLFGPIVANLEGRIRAAIDLDFGFDTAGLAAWRDTRFQADQAYRIFDGFYVDDNRDPTNGSDRPEAELTGEISASAGLSIGIAGIYVGGGLAASLFADLEDEGENGGDLGNSDGKIRGSQIADLIDQGRIGCLFNFGGQFDAFLQAKARFLFYTKRWTFARVTLARFEFDPCPGDAPILANEGAERDGIPTQNPELWLNMGSRAGERRSGNTTDGSEIFDLRGSGATSNETVRVTAFGFTQDYQGVNHIYANGGAENDVIRTVIEEVDETGATLNTIDTIAVPVEFAGGAGDDWLQGGLVGDRLQGDEGNDILEGRGGNDWIGGGDGEDLIEGDDGDDWLEGGAGNDLLEGGQGRDILYGDLETTQGNDLLFGGDGIDDVFGGAGNDLLVGGNDNDALYGGDGDDQLFGDDQQFAETGDDLLMGDAGNDHISGGNGMDTVSYYSSPNGVVVNIDEEQIYDGLEDPSGLESEFAIGAGQAFDGFGTTDHFRFTVQRRDYNDAGEVISEADIMISGSLENIIGSVHTDILIGNRQANHIDALAGHDLLISTAGDDMLDGNEGIDTVSYRRDPNAVYVNLDESTAYQNPGGYLHTTVVSDRPIPTDTEPNFALDAGTAVDGFGNTDTLRNLEHAIGSAFNDVLIGNAQDNQLEGLAGDDVLTGQAGNDRLAGGVGSDTISYRRDPAAVSVNLEQNQATDGFGDTDQITAVENVIGSALDDEMIGDAIANILIAGSGRDRVHARAGDDILFGEAGQDSLFGELGNDFIVGGTEADLIHGGAGNDTASYFTATNTVIASLTTGRGTTGDARGDLFTSIQNLEGSEYSDRLIGDAIDNILSGLGGDDYLDGRDGDDTIYGGDGGDRIQGAAGNDIAYGNAGDDALNGNQGNDILKGGDGSDDLWGDQGTDALYGQAGNDALSGGDGNDRLEGGIGVDILDGGTGNDTLLGGEDADFLLGAEGDDGLYGDTGDDNLDGGTGNDILNGGAGNDFGYGAEGDDQLWGGEQDDYLEGGLGNDRLSGDEGDDFLYGQAGDDTLEGGIGQDNLVGDEGNDRLNGHTGIDLLEGGQGNDQISGGIGDDRLIGGGDRDRFIIRLGDGLDTIIDFGGIGTGTNPSQSLVNEADAIQFAGSGLIAQNMLLTQQGNDLLISFVNVDATSVILENFELQNLDNLTQATGSSVNVSNIFFDGQNTVQDSFDVLNANDQPSIVLRSNTVSFLNDLDNTTRGFNSSDDVINGQGGNDRLEGLSGNDVLRGGDGNDILIGRLGQDTLIGGNGSDTFALKQGEGSDTIHQFESDRDWIGLSGGLTFNQLSITQGIGSNISNTLISVTHTGELLASLTGIQATTVTTTNFALV